MGPRRLVTDSRSGTSHRHPRSPHGNHEKAAGLIRLCLGHSQNHLAVAGGYEVERSDQGCAPTRYREVVLTVSKLRPGINKSWNLYGQIHTNPQRTRGRCRRSRTTAACPATCRSEEHTSELQSL